jgi:hypothetical protein
MTRRGFALFAAALPVIGRAQAKREEPGPAVGAHIPMFQLPDQDGKMRDLRNLTGAKGLMLVFVRSADW